MKKIALSLVTLLYLMLSTGFTMELHFCMGRFAGLDFSIEKNEKCAQCGMTEKQTGCCKDELKFYKLDDSFKHNNSNVFLTDKKYSQGTGFLDFYDSQSATVNLIVAVINQLQEIHPNGPPIFLRNQVFRL